MPCPPYIVQNDLNLFCLPSIWNLRYLLSKCINKLNRLFLQVLLLCICICMRFCFLIWLLTLTHFLRLRNLVDRDKLSRSDPICVVYITKPHRKHWVEYARTEVQENTFNPQWNTKVQMT